MRRYYKRSYSILFFVLSAIFFLSAYHYGNDDDLAITAAVQVSSNAKNLSKEKTEQKKKTKKDDESSDWNKHKRAEEKIGDTEELKDEKLEEQVDIDSEEKTDMKSEDKTDTDSVDKTDTDSKENVDKLTIIAVGDDLIHTQIIRSGKTQKGSYNFDHLFSGIEKEVENADLAMINQETILCDPSLGYSGYPLFGSPYEIGEAIHSAGFDVVLHATNHVLDKGTAGIKDSIEFWKKYEDITVAGINESDKVEDRVKIIEKNHITIAIINYTYGLNGLRIPKGKEYMVNLLTNQKQLKKDIAYAKKHSDFVIVCPHWGTEYVYRPTKEQERLTKFFVQEEVDLVIGTHPHVLQPVEWLENEEGTHKTLVYYSLGNFISNQDAMPRMLGGMAKIQLEKKENQVQISQADISPLVTHTYYNAGQKFTTYLLSEYNEKIAKNHSLNRKRRDTLTYKKLNDLCHNILGDWYDQTYKVS